MQNGNFPDDQRLTKAMDHLLASVATKILTLHFQFSFSNYNKFRKLMRIISGLREIVKMGDFFNSNQMLRLQHESQYRTFTGGLISFGIIITIIVAFASMILDTMNRTIITFSHKEQRSSDPPLSTLTASSDVFMFGVEVWGYNLSSENRLFDVVFNQVESNYGENYTYTQYALEPCTRAHWAALPDVLDRFDNLHVGNWLCPTMGTAMKLQGKYSSAQYHQFSVTLYPCSNSTDPSRPCGSPDELSQFLQSNGQWNYFTYYYVNSIINADSPQYKNLYLEDRSYIVFGEKMGAELDMYLSQIDITSDNSIWPFEELSQDVVYWIRFSPILYPFAVNNGTSFATFYVMKDPSTQTYERQVQKIFVVFSFMGGLIGAIMAGLFIMNAYTSFAFEIALATQVFKDDEQSKTHKILKKASKGSVNVLHFIQYYLYQVYKKIKGDISWPFIEYLKQCREEILFQLDVKGLIKRVIFLEFAISYMLEDFQISEMQKEKPIQPGQIRKLREKIQAREQELSEKESVSTNKPLFLQPDSIIEKPFPTSDYEIGLQNQLEIPNTPKQQIRADDKKKSIEIVVRNNDDKQIQVKRLRNIRKIRNSALEGDPISKRLLFSIIKKPQEKLSSSNSIEKEDFEFPSTFKQT